MMAKPGEPTNEPAERSSWPVKKYRLGAEPSEDLGATTTVKERLAMVEALSAEAFALSGHKEGKTPRSEWPIAIRRLGQQARRS